MRFSIQAQTGYRLCWDVLPMNFEVWPRPGHTPVLQLWLWSGDVSHHGHFQVPCLRPPPHLPISFTSCEAFASTPGASEADIHYIPDRDGALHAFSSALYAHAPRPQIRSPRHRRRRRSPPRELFTTDFWTWVARCNSSTVDAAFDFTEAADTFEADNLVLLL